MCKNILTENCSFEKVKQNQSRSQFIHSIQTRSLGKTGKTGKIWKNTFTPKTITICVKIIPNENRSFTESEIGRASIMIYTNFCVVEPGEV